MQSPKAAEAEEGLDVTNFGGGLADPRWARGPAETLPVRLDPTLRKAVDDRAAAGRTTASEVVREALRDYLEVG
jgi:hypothetical protein